MAATLLAGCAGAVLAEIIVPTASEAQPSHNLFLSARARSQSDRFFQDWFGPSNWKGQQPRRHRPHGDPSQRRRTRPTGDRPAIPELPEARGTSAITKDIPLPRPRPPEWPEPHSFVEAAGPDFNSADVTSSPSDCDQRLASIAVIELLPRLIGPGNCGGRDMVQLDSVLLPDHRHIEVRPAAILRCPMAESFAAWIRGEASPRIDRVDTRLHAIETYGSYECRGRNGLPDAKLSEHGKGNAIDVRALVLTHGRRSELTDVTVEKSIREDLRDSVCHRFTTVLGPGADRHHENHIHLDNLERARGHRLCEWDVREPPRVVRIASGNVPPANASSETVGQRRKDKDHTITVGPWAIAIATSNKANKFERCTMSRSEGELAITFARTQNGLTLILESPKWKLDRGKTYPVRLSAGSRSVNAKALAEAKSVSIALDDPRLNSKLRSVRSLEVRAEADTLHVPLNGSSAAFQRLEGCFNNAEHSEANPFVRRKAVDTNPFVSPNRKR
ncbi:MAG TPA: extensin family protein [Pseudolabrys sp.]|nr:extensin family protein [Pseudolabrys sp.]